MVSRRNFFSITIMMIVLFFLFQFFMVMRDGENVYDENTYLTAKMYMVIPHLSERGLWEMKGDAMGGPYVMHRIHTHY